MKLAVIIPYYKFTFFRETLKSLAAQTDKRFHVYIGNDASTEDPLELLNEFKGKFNFTYKKFEQNLGSISLSKHWDRCLSMMNQEQWFMILGDDDYISRNLVAIFHERFPEINYRHHVVRFSSQVINEMGFAKSKVYVQPEQEDAICSYQRKLMGYNRSSLSEYVFKVSKYKKYGFQDYPLAWTSDDRAIIDFCEGKNIFSINKATVYIRMSSRNISSIVANSELMERAVLQSTRELIADYRRKMNSTQLRFFIKKYENCTLKGNHVNSKDLLNVALLFLLYMPLRSKVYILKVLISRGLK